MMALLEHRIPPPVVALALGWGMWWSAGQGLSTSLSWAAPMPAQVLRGIAIALACAGVALDLVGLIAFLHARTTVNPLRPQASSALVTGGLYRHSRNPMYLGQLLVLCGWALWLGNAVALAGPVLFVLWLNRFQIGPEERALSARFGAAYEAYRGQVRRWI